MTSIARGIISIVLMLPILFVAEARAQINILDTMLGIGAAAILEEARRNGTIGTSPPGQQGPVAAGAQQPPASTVDPGVAAIQMRLNALGFDAGPADGVMGRRTTDAVAAFQRSIGSPSTGSLTPADRAVLLTIGQGGSGQTAATTAFSGIASPPTTTAVSLPAAFDVHYDVDLPGNDFRSGMDESGLRDIDLNACMAACGADRSCNAFTYNARAEVCFLKTVGANATPFSGAISGSRAGAVGQPTMPVFDGVRPLTPSEVYTVQAALNAQGYDAGSPDGVAGSQTRAAIARFLATNPGAASANLDTRLYQALVGGASPGSATPSAPLATEPATPLKAEAYPDIETLRDTFERIAIARDPSLLDDLERVLGFFENEHGSIYGWDRTERGERYADANSVEREAMLVAYADELQAESDALYARIVADGLRLSLRWRAPVGDYVEGQGLGIGGANAELVTSQTFSHRAGATRTEFVGLVLEQPDFSRIPIGSAAEASALLDTLTARSWNGLADVVVYLTITEFGTDRNVVGAAVADPEDVPVTVRLDQAVLTTVGDHTRTRFAGGEVLHVFGHDQTPAGPLPGGDTLAIAVANGLPIVDGHIVWPADSNGGYEIDRAFGTSDYLRSLTRFVNLAAIGRDPELASDNLANETVRSLLDPGQHMRVYGSELQRFYSFENEFQRRRAADVFDAEVLPILAAQAPSFPMDVVTIRRVGTGEYDFDTLAFPIDYYSGAETGVIAFPRTLRQLSNAALFRNLPPALPMAMDEAETFVTTGGDYRNLYIATFGRIDVVAEDEAGIAVSFAPNRVAIFADATLTTPMLELDTAMIDTGDEPIAAPVVGDDERRLAEIAPVTELALLGLAFEAATATGQDGAMVRSNYLVERANEFEQAEAMAAARTTLETGVAPEEIWIAGELVLGSYDLEAGTFAIEDLEFGSLAGESEFRAGYSFVITNPEALRTIAVAAEPARAIVEEQGRRLSILLRVAVNGIQVDTEGSYPRYEYAFAVQHLLGWIDPGSNKPPSMIVAEAEFSATSAVALALPAPTPITQLDNEALDYLRLVHAPQTVTESTYLRMMVARWNKEQRNEIVGDPLFPEGIDLSVPAVRDLWLPRFTAWADERAALLGNRLTVTLPTSDSACANIVVADRWRSGLRTLFEPLRPDLEAAVDVRGTMGRFQTEHVMTPVMLELDGYEMEADSCTASADTLIEAFGLPYGAPSGALVVIDGLIAPGGGQRAPIAVDVDLASIVALTDGERVNPPLLIDARFVAARYPTAEGETAFTRADYDDLTNAFAEGELPETWDIVGLKPGQTLKEAEAIVRAHMPVTAAFAWTGGANGDVHFLNRRAFVSETLSESITLVYEPSARGDIVHAVVRHLGQAVDTMPTDAIIAGLQAKYGPASRDVRHGEQAIDLYWHARSEPRTTSNDLQQCGSTVGLWNDWELLEGSIDAVPMDVPDHLAVRGYLQLPGPRDTGADLLAIGALDCGASVQAWKATSGNNDVLLIQLIDYAGYQSAYADASALAEAAAATVDEEAAEPTEDLGFEF
jgi:peptidoglycan hydrolase-like protein with peptidoglycan-binding domain